MKKNRGKTKINLMFFVYIFGQGGAERVILNILNHINNVKYNITLILGSEIDNHQYLKQLTNKNVRIDYLGVPFRNDDAAINSLAKTINQYNPDVLITEAKYTNYLSYHAKKLSKNHHVKLIFREAVNRSACKDEGFIQKLKTSLHYNFGPSKIICVSQGVADDLVNHYKIRKKKIVVIYNPTDLSLINIKSNEPINNSTFAKIKGKKIITVGRLSPSKNQKLLLNAFSKIKTKNISLILLGSGELEAELKDHCKKNAIKNIYFLGNVPNPYQFVKNSDLFVLSSLREGAANVIIESMAVGTPIISTDCPSGPKELIKNNKYGLLAPLNDENTLAALIDKVLNNPVLRKKYSKLGKIRCQDFAIEKLVPRYEKLIDDIIKKEQL
ncbi:glycosyltransferase [Candidatus Saccharibacteria bacterium]|nr:glycosyltransferase [Candidatus Saccharibacteria bacterium]